MKQGWEIKKLKELGITQTGTTPKTSEKEYYGNFIPFIKPADVDIDENGKLRYDNEGLSESGLTKARKISKNSILMVCIGATIGKLGFSEIDFACNQQINTITFNKELYPKFFYYAMKTKEFQDKVILEGKGSQATLPIINKSKWEELTVSYPKSLSEQKRIVAILDKCFAAIDKAKSNAEQNLKNAKELFESYLQGAFENKGEDWEEKTLKEVCAKITDGTHQTPKYFEEGIIFLSSKNVTSGKIDWDNVKYIDKKQHLEMHKRVAPRRGDILLAKNGTTGVAAMVDKDVVFDIYVSLAHIRVLDEIIPEFMLFFINSPVAKKQFNKRLKGSGVPNLHLEEIREVIITFPKLKEKQNQIVSQLDTLRAETQKLEAIYQKKLEDLEELKKSILQKAFKGELMSEPLIEVD